MSNVVARMTVQAAGALGALRASVRGLSGIFSRLSEEHRELVALLEQTTSADDHDSREQFWANARSELLAHEGAEQQYVYRYLERHPKLVVIAKQHDADARALESSIASVDACSLGTEQWRAALERLERDVRQHVEREEDFFVIAQDVLGSGRAKEIEGLYTNGRRSLLHDLKAPTDSDPADGR